jgi:hypothetical protein
LIESCTVLNLREKEKFWIEHCIKLNKSYNIYTLVYSNLNNKKDIAKNIPYVMQPETRAKMSKSRMGNTIRRGSTMPESAKKAISDKMMGNQHLKGHVHSEESKRKTSATLKLTWARRKECQK